jgi:hypothetical protein
MFAAALAEVSPVLDERARRLLLGAGARRLGRGGIKVIAAATGTSADTVGRGATELETGRLPTCTVMPSMAIGTTP